MVADRMTLEIITPEKVLFKGEADSVRLPGKKAPFVVLRNHAPLISVLDCGVVAWKGDGGEDNVEISGGFAEVFDNNVTVCVELP
jgi:F-type H+-transporting ATPase subunit epsilon